MVEIIANLHPCHHCEGKGTCKNGEDGTSCLVCAKKGELPFWRRQHQRGLLCGSCGGIGKAEPMTERLNKRIAPVLAIVLILGLLALVFWAAALQSQFFTEILTFASAIIGTVVGFYFSSKAASS